MYCTDFDRVKIAIFCRFVSSTKRFAIAITFFLFSQCDFWMEWQKLFVSFLSFITSEVCDKDWTQLIGLDTLKDDGRRFKDQKKLIK